MKVLIMGFGLHGGGLETAKYLLKHGADLTVTDLRDEKTLSPSINELETACNEEGCRFHVRYVLGRHEYEDFKNADMVIKNPAVRPDSPYLKAASFPHEVKALVETDISLFLSAIYEKKLNIRLTAVTGSKGKSGTASAIHFVLSQLKKNQGSYLGGNITKSPLSFLDKLKPYDDAVLELSSWQLRDLKDRITLDGKSFLLKPKAAVLTAIFPDHQDYYNSMEAYINDKKIICQGQNADDFIIAQNDSWGNIFISESKARPLAYSDSRLPEGVFGGWLEGASDPGFIRLFDGSVAELVPAKPLILGTHQKKNLLAAGLALYSLGFPIAGIKEALGSFPGIPHRMEMFHKSRGLSFYNDSAATIPEAAAASISALCETNGGNLILVTGGTDKNLDFSALAKAASTAKKIILLTGSASDKLSALFKDAGVDFSGPYNQIESAAKKAIEAAAAGDCIILSPGCASFGMFLNEFDRGNKWKEAVLGLENNGFRII